MKEIAAGYLKGMVGYLREMVGYLTAAMVVNWKRNYSDYLKDETAREEAEEIRCFHNLWSPACYGTLKTANSGPLALEDF